MTRLNLFFLPFLFLGTMVFGQTYYLHFDPDCMDRYEFVTDIDKTPYVVYSSNTASGGLIHLDVGKEQVKWVKDLPDQLTECHSFNFNKGMANAINGGSVKIYMVRESPTHYNISPVEKVTYIISNDRSLNISMIDTDFTLDWQRMVSNKNLSTSTSEKEVYLEGTIKYDCLKGYIFRKKDGNQSESFKEYTIIPEVGIISKRSVPYEGAVTNSLRLDRIGGSGMMDFIKDVCADNGSQPVVEEKKSAAAAEKGQTYTKSAATVPTSYGNTGPCPTSNKNGFHVVQKGETLYNISKRYGISVSQLKAWNRIDNKNIISLCQELQVTTQTNQGTTTPKGSTGSNTNAAKQEYHIVKPSQTVSQLANMYGFTEERFRKMNNLGPYERIYAGQKLFSNDCDCPNTTGVGGDAPMPYDLMEQPRLTAKGNPDVYFKPVKVHVVKGGESLFAISKQYDTSVDRIKELNGLEKNNQLKKGQSIYVQ